MRVEEGVGPAPRSGALRRRTEGSFGVISAGQQKRSRPSPPEGHQTPRVAPRSPLSRYRGLLTASRGRMGRVVNRSSSQRRSFPAARWPLPRGCRAFCRRPGQRPPSCGHLGALGAFSAPLRFLSLGRPAAQPLRSALLCGRVGPRAELRLACPPSGQHGPGAVAGAPRPSPGAWAEGCRE